MYLLMDTAIYYASNIWARYAFVPTNAYLLVGAPPKTP